MPTDGDNLHLDVARLELPTTSMIYVEYPRDRAEIVPGFHCAPRRQLVLCLEGSFEVVTSLGQSRLFQPGDWLLADDVGSRGHITKGVGSDRRVNLAIGIDEEWTLPTA